MYICTCDGVCLCVDMYMFIYMIVSCKFIRAHIAFCMYVMTMYSAVRMPLVSNCAR